MIDSMTKTSLRVATDGAAGPYIELPASQLAEVEPLLASHGIRYWVEEDEISLNGGPFIAVINLGRDADAAVVQRILDSVH